MPTDFRKLAELEQIPDPDRFLPALTKLDAAFAKVRADLAAPAEIAIHPQYSEAGAAGIEAKP